MSDFLTLEQTDPRFESLILGTFSSRQRALPVPSFRGAEVSRGEGTSRHFTFELVELADLQIPPIWKIVLAAGRWELLPLSLSPLLSTFLLLDVFGETLSILKLVSSTLGVIALHASVFLINDGSDHLRGLEAKVIQKGWLTANQSLRWGRLLLIFGVLLGLPCILFSKGGLLLIAAFAPLAILGFNHRRFGLKYWGLGDALIFLAFGPMLVAGAALAVSGEIPLEIWHSGILWGWVAVAIFHLRNFERLFIDSQQSGTFLSRLGFDRAKKFLVVQMMALFLVWTSWTFELHHIWLWIPTVVYVGGVVALQILKISKIISPLSSLRQNLARDFLLRLLLAPLILAGLTWLDRLFP
jgi:1,4-dihydroxy-2-naphthoate octaprenyltransferase